MTEFFTNCYIWLAENYKEITMTLTTAQFASLISALVLLIRSIRKTSENTTTSKKLNESIIKTNEMSDVVQSLKEEIVKIKQDNQRFERAMEKNQTDIIDFFDTQGSKINAMLEVQSIVYSTIKDEKIRGTVNSVLINAKYAETASRAKLRQEIAELKTKVEEKMQEVNEDVKKTVNVVNSIVDPSENKDSDVVRY